MTNDGVLEYADTGLLSPGWADTDVGELLDDRAWVRAMVEAEVALARAQARCGMIPAESARIIAAAADPGRIDLRGLVAGVRATANPVVALVAQLTAAAAALDTGAADHVHCGSTSQDILDSAMMLLCARTLRRVLDDLRRAAGAAAGLADRYRGTPMAGRTLTQHAVPITFGLKATTWLQLLLDAIDRVRRVLDGGLPASLGGAAGTLAAYQEYANGAGADGSIELAAAFAAELGLAEPLVPWHGARTPIADVASALCVATGALGKIAADVQVLTRSEIGEVAEATAAGRGASSAMPQKRNPVYATMIATAARQVPPYALVLYQSMIVEDERSAGGWHAEWQPLREALRLTAGAARNAVELLAGLTVFPERMRANLALTAGAVVSERLTVALAPVLGRRAAKELLAQATRRSGTTGRDLADLVTESARAAGHELDRDRLRELIRPETYLGAAEALVERALRRYRSASTVR
ncbi:3-carboxy-cis,cis-muconate cycloisomerase [Nocardia terpenica]|uniref:3-carboxy-cis,cis-muconate cycloisomerase n=1 Tax=Nocardia terpenica TaxID=455432 RepID=A0A291RGB1_9NOCA|nr:3-carboxy-cis,cis-muconate cycloisomerase [Nocardia terpenica]